MRSLDNILEIFAFGVSVGVVGTLLVQYLAAHLRWV